MTFETRKRLATHFAKQGDKKHPYCLEMKKNKGDNPNTEIIEEPVVGLDDESDEGSEDGS
jgi:hypothetical protein